MYAIWIGNRLPQGIDLNTLDIQHYISTGSCCIEQYNTSLPNEVHRLFNKYGGTLLIFSHLDGMTIYGFKNHGTSNYEEINSKYLASAINYLDRTVARVRYGNSSEQEAHCSRVLMADCTFMITYNYQAKLSTIHNIIELRKQMFLYLTNNQIIKFIPPQPILKQTETDHEYIREPSVPTIINIPTSIQSSPTLSNTKSIIDLSTITSTAIGIGLSSFLG